MATELSARRAAFHVGFWLIIAFLVRSTLLEVLRLPDSRYELEGYAVETFVPVPRPCDIRDDVGAPIFPVGAPMPEPNETTTPQTMANMDSPVLQPAKLSMVRPRLPPTFIPWVTLIDKHSMPQVFKRHMISKYLHGAVGWNSMLVLAMPDAPEDLRAWATGLGISIENVSAPIGGLNIWCATQFERAVFMGANTVVTRDVRRLVDMCANETDLCGVSAGYDLPNYFVDPGVIIARPSAAHCEAIGALARNFSTSPEAVVPESAVPVAGSGHAASPSRISQIGPKEEKAILNQYFGIERRKAVDPRYNTILDEARTVHKAGDAIVIQYVPGKRIRSAQRSFRQVLARADRDVDLFEARRTGNVAKSVLFATLLTPSPNGTIPVSSTAETFKYHHYSKFLFGKIPWKKQAVLYTEDAYPEYRAWLESKGGKAIRVPPLLCMQGRSRYKYQFTKLHLWNLTDYEYVVYTDLDTFILRDIRNMWTSCPDDVPLCSVEETWRLPKSHYVNGGLLVARPSAENFKNLIEGRANYTKSTYFCEQDFLNFFLGKSRVGMLDPSFNTMSFDTKRTNSLLDAKIAHLRWREVKGLQAIVTPEERSYMLDRKDKIDNLIAKEKKGK